MNYQFKMQPRAYQQSIFESARNQNTLVVLPTGVGKTLIALMLAVERLEKFPQKKIVMLAPTRPLVEQHLKSFQEELPELFAEMQLFTGSVNAKNRKKAWQTAEIIFSTPQCVANDLKNNLYDLKNVSLLIIDEAHRCLKNYDYTKVAASYNSQGEEQLILGLTASPGSEPEKVKQICKHLNIKEVEVRTRDSSDVKPYLQERLFEKVLVPFPAEFVEIKKLLQNIYDDKVSELRRRNVLFGPANKVALLQLQNRLANQVQQERRNFNAMRGMSLCAQAIKISHAIELLETQTLSGVQEYMEGLEKQAEIKKSRGVVQLVGSQNFQKSLSSIRDLRKKGVEHPKIEELRTLLEEEFASTNKDKVFRAIVFVQFRETAMAIVQKINLISGIVSKVFVGQAKKTGARGNSGLSQKEQRAVIEEFRQGSVNVIVATSIGEEGLDIPEVNAVYFYETIPSAIRKIQRAGRTARLAPGKLFILITKDTRDEIYHYASSAREKKMHRTIEQVRKDIKSKGIFDYVPKK